MAKMNCIVKTTHVLVSIAAAILKSVFTLRMCVTVSSNALNTKTSLHVKCPVRLAVYV